MPRFHIWNNGRSVINIDQIARIEVQPEYLGNHPTGKLLYVVHFSLTYKCFITQEEYLVLMETIANGNS